MSSARGMRALLLLAASVLAACSGNHSALNPTGPRAAQIAELLLIFTVVSALVYLIVIAFLSFLLWRSRSRSEDVHLTPDEREESRSKVLIAAGLGVTIVTLIGFATADFAVTRELTRKPQDPLRIRITGQQFWWQIEYEDPIPSRRLVTANEFNIPVGRPVEVTLVSRDVIHSFWLPNLSGKRDLIPGYTNHEIVLAEQAGTYMGQCAEFCGYQHARMRLIVNAQPPAEFERWMAQQLTPAREPQSQAETRGRAVFLRSSCVLCHSIQGTVAAATVGPDLTHVASRQMLAAGAMPNTRAHLAGWIADPQRIKPGTRMPPNALSGRDLTDLVAYLASLK